MFLLIIQVCVEVCGFIYLFLFEKNMVKAPKEGQRSGSIEIVWSFFF